MSTGPSHAARCVVNGGPGVPPGTCAGCATSVDDEIDVLLAEADRLIGGYW